MPLYVNNAEITDDEVFTEMQFHPAKTREEARDEAAKALLIRELLRQEAVTKELVSDSADEEETEAAILKLVEAEVSTPEATTEACRRYYDHNIDRFALSENSPLPQAFENVEPRIKDYLHTRSVRHGIQSYILDLAGRAKIAGFDLAATL